MFTPKQKCKQIVDSPSTPLSFSRELRQVLQERNLLTAKTRSKVCSMLDSSFNSPLNSPNPEAGKRKSFRLKAIEEIVNSEKSYLAQLEILMNFFIRPLKEQAIIELAHHTTLFGHIEMIYNLNGEFLRELQLNMDNVAPAFLKMAPFFKLYSVYAFDYRAALFLLQDLTSKNPVFRNFLQENESRPEVQRKLNSLMIVPIQRVPRYKLLLDQVLLYTSPADADYKLLKESVKQIEATASHINACVEEQEITQYLIHLQNSLVNRSPNIVKPSRRVIKEGVLQKITRNGNEIKRYCVLMSDIFMYCKINKERLPNTVVENSLECCCIFPLKKCKVYEMLPGNFKITCQNDGIIFGTTDLQLGRAWVGFIRDAIDLHIQCRKTLRKESSKRTPIRKKDLKKFDEDYVLSPSKKRCDYETVFRNKNRSTDSEEEADDDAFLITGCFPRKRKIPNCTTNNISTSTVTNVPKTIKLLKRPAAPPPPPPPLPVSLNKNENNMHLPLSICGTSAVPVKENRLAKMCKKISTDKVINMHGILKRTSATVTVTTTTTTSTAATNGMLQENASNDHDLTYDFASRYSDSKSNFSAHNVDNTIQTVVRREDLFNNTDTADLGDGNFCDVLFPLRSSGGSQNNGFSGWRVPQASIKENIELTSPPQKKRVKFDDTTLEMPPTVQPYRFTNAPKGTNSDNVAVLRDRIYDFFANLF